MSEPLPTLAAMMPSPTEGSTPGSEDIGRTITVIRRNVSGPNAGNVEVFCGTLTALSYCPAEVHESNTLPPEIAKLTNMSEEDNRHQHVDPEQIMFVIGASRFVVVLSEHDWSYTVGA